VPAPTVSIELFGMPRHQAGVARFTAPAATIIDALHRLEAACPGLAGLVSKDGNLSPQYLLSVDGERFLGTLDQSIHDGARLLLLSADAGG
jgi:molybdopterin converting factor small subunit